MYSYIYIYIYMYAYLYTTLLYRLYIYIYICMTVQPSKECRLGRLAGKRFFFRLTTLHNMVMVLLVGGLLQCSRVGYFWGEGEKHTQ